jgi:hypothetical protein
MSNISLCDPPFQSVRAGFARDVSRDFERPIEPREGDQLLVLQMLTGQHAHGVRVHGALDRALRGFVDRAPQIDSRDLRDEKRMKLCDNEFHAAPPGLRLPTTRLELAPIVP